MSINILIEIAVKTKKSGGGIMKKYLTVIFCAALISIAGFTAVKAGYFTGPNNSLYVEVTGGWNWSKGTLSNDSEQHYKKIYVQLGNQGSWSSLVSPSTHSVSQKDTKGLFEKDYAFVNPCWKTSSDGNLICRS